MELANRWTLVLMMQKRVHVRRLKLRKQQRFFVGKYEAGDLEQLKRCARAKYTENLQST